MVCVSNTAQDPNFNGPPEQRELVPEAIHSGRGEHKNNPNSIDVKNYGPIPPGKYDMFPNEKPGREGWWSLKDQDWIPGLSALAYKLGLRRAGANLHIGTSSWGCLTVDEKYKDQFDQLTNLLSKEKGNNVLTVTK